MLLSRFAVKQILRLSVKILWFTAKMANDPENIGGIPVTSEAIGFAADEMILCGKCAKTNPPNRLNCFYCGHGLELSEELAAGIRFAPSEIEDWEPGINLVVTSGVNDLDPQAIAAAISLGAEVTDSLANVEPPFPLFRIKPDEADEVEARLKRLGLSVSRVEDAALALTKPAIRLKGIDLTTDPLTFHPFNSETSTSVNASDIVLVVAGSIVTTTAESKLKKTRKDIKEIDSHISSSDHTAIDIYTSADEVGYRILPHGFDFSCLGAAKSLIAADNVRKLIEKLADDFPNAVIDRSYASKAAILDHVWPPTVTNISKGIARSWFGVQRATGTATSNESQFTRYSRMRRKLI